MLVASNYGVCGVNLPSPMKMILLNAICIEHLNIKIGFKNLKIMIHLIEYSQSNKIHVIEYLSSEVLKMQK